MKSRLQNSLVYRKFQNSGGNEYDGTQKGSDRTLRGSFVELHQGRDGQSAIEDGIKLAPSAPKELAIPGHGVSRGQSVDSDNSNLPILSA